MTEKKKIYLLALFFGIFNLALLFLIVFPLLGKIEESSKELVLQNQKLISFSKGEENLRGLENTYQIHQKDLEKIESLYIDPETPIDFISFLEKMAFDSRAEIEISLVSEKIQETDFGKALSFNISLKTFYPNFLKFLERLENSPYLVEILDLNIKKSGEKIEAPFSLNVLTK